MSELGDERNPLLGLLEPGRDDLLHKILVDLIAQLRDPGNYATRTVLADQAEARLREVQRP